MNKEQMIVENMAIVKVIARQYFVPSGWEEDVMQEGYYGLCVAAEKYDPTRGVTFRSYAAWWVRFYVGRMLHNVPVVSIAERTELGEIEMVEMDGSADGEETETLSMEDVLAGEETADGELMREEEEKEMAMRLKRLSRRELQIISLRYGLEGEEMSTREVAKAVGLSYDRVKKILGQSYRKMQKN